MVRIYRRIHDLPFGAGSDHVSQVIVVDQSMVGKDKPVSLIIQLHNLVSSFSWSGKCINFVIRNFQKLVEPHRRLVCYCRLNQIIDRNKRQPANAHQREVFLFNDILLVCFQHHSIWQFNDDLFQRSTRHSWECISPNFYIAEENILRKTFKFKYMVLKYSAIVDCKNGFKKEIMLPVCVAHVDDAFGTTC